MSDSDYVSVFNAEDEYTAIIVKTALEDSGIEAVIEPLNKSIVFDGAIALASGYWGDVMVPESDAARAAEVLREYSSQAKNSDNNETENDSSKDIM